MYCIGNYGLSSRRWFINGNLYIKNTEPFLFYLWVSFADPRIQVDALRAVYKERGYLLRSSISKQLLREQISKEQKKRFSLVAQHADIRLPMAKLQALREEFEWDETFALLQTMREDYLQLAKYQGNGREARWTPQIRGQSSGL